MKMIIPERTVEFVMAEEEVNILKKAFCIFKEMYSDLPSYEKNLSRVCGSLDILFDYNFNKESNTFSFKTDDEDIL